MMVQERWNALMVDNTVVFRILVLIHLLNYIDRGIVPGSSIEFESFISHHIETAQPDVFLGLLQSAYVIGYVVGSMIFARMVHYRGRFEITGIGSAIWAAALICSGLSIRVSSYTLLVIARTFSGFGESSLHCTIPPWIEDTAPENSKASWLSIFYVALPVGLAFGYTYSSFIALSIGIEWAFYILGIVMIPLIYYIFAISKYFPYENLSNKYDKIPDKTPTLYEELTNVLSRYTFNCILFASAAVAATLMGVSTFGSTFMMGLGYFKSETESSTTFGILVSLAGIIGTIFGGFLLDMQLKQCRMKYNEEEFYSNYAKTYQVDLNNEEEKGLIQETLSSEVLEGVINLDKKVTQSPSHNDIYSIRKIKTVLFMVTCCTFCSLISLGSVYFIYNRTLYLVMLTIGCSFIFMCASPIAMAVMNSTPMESNAFALAFANMCAHILGDVPSPIVAGWLKDYFAPGCSLKSLSGLIENGLITVEEYDEATKSVALSQECRDEDSNIRFVMFLMFLWLSWAVFFFFIAYRKCKWDLDIISKL